MNALRKLFASYFSLGVIIGALPYNIQNGQQEDANPVMANFNSIISQVNTNVPALIPSLGTLNPFTPTCFFGGNHVGMTFFSQTGWYINFGGFVFFMFDVSVSAKGSSNGVLTVGGLPFTINAGLGALSEFGGALCTVSIAIPSGGNGVAPYWALIPNTTTLACQQVSPTTLVNISDANCGATFRVAGSGFYFT